MLNLSIRECEQAIIEELNSFAIPIEAKRLILQNVLNKVTVEADKQVAEETLHILENRKETETNAESV